MTEILEHYPITPHYKKAGSVYPNPPGEAFKTHVVVLDFTGRSGGKVSIPVRCWSLVEKGTAERMVLAGQGRYETDDEKKQAVANGHQRHVGQAPKHGEVLKPVSAGEYKDPNPQAEAGDDDGEEGELTEEAPEAEAEAGKKPAAKATGKKAGGRAKKG